MATATLVRGNGYWIQDNTLYKNVSQQDKDWTWYIGQWKQDYWTAAEYGAGCVEYSAPPIADRLLSRTVTIPCSFYGLRGECTAYAVLSTTMPADKDLSFRHGPTSGVISNTIKFSYKDTNLSFTLDDSVDISGRTIYLYMYRPYEGVGTYGPDIAIVTKSFSDGTVEYSDPYTLTINAGLGSIVTVNRTFSGTGDIGDLQDSAPLYFGDKLKITFEPNSNYKLTSSKVNGETFASGNIYTVSGDVAVTATAQVLASGVGATDANIESTSTITIARADNTYTHTLTYSFGALVGTIVTNTASGSVAWTVPAEFYDEIPNSPTGLCTIICETFSGSTSLGQTTCSMTVTAEQSKCQPTVSGVVIDINAATVLLTGNNTTLIRYLSTAECTISAVANKGASIASMSILGESVTESVPTVIYANVEQTLFQFSATDSRGYTTTINVYPEIVPYVKLTLNPVVSRPFPTSGEVVLSFNGRFYGGNIGGSTNTLAIRYRYRAASDAAYSPWIPVDDNKFVAGSSSYYSHGNILLADNDGSTTGFDYRTSYVFEVQAYDGTNGNMLSSVSSVVTIQRGMPVFDWGENDFNFNVPIVIGSGTAGVPSGVLKRFENGVWIGNAAPINDDGVFVSKENYHGFFIDTENGKVYVVSDANMQNVYTGDTIAKFG